MKNLLFVIPGIVLALSACSTKKEMRASGYTQGTTYSVIYFNDGENLQYQIDSILLDFDRVLSTYQENSYISKWNRREANSEQPQLFREVVKAGIEVSKSTNGAFDMTVSPLMNFWFGKDWNSESVDSAVVDSVMKFVGSDYILLENGSYTSDQPNLKLDVNAIAQGYSVDIVSRFLESEAITNYLVEIGGEVRASGAKINGDSWRIGIDKPDGQNFERDLALSIELNNKSLATSGNYRKFIEINGQKFGHTLDPRTGYPAKTDVLSATVIANNCMIADAYATACMVLGFERSKKLVNTDDELDAILIYSTNNGKLNIWDSRDE